VFVLHQHTSALVLQYKPNPEEDFPPVACSRLPTKVADEGLTRKKRRFADGTGDEDRTHASSLTGFIVMAGGAVAGFLWIRRTTPPQPGNDRNQPKITQFTRQGPLRSLKMRR